jgi:hypothetical protein
MDKQMVVDFVKFLLERPRLVVSLWFLECQEYRVVDHVYDKENNLENKNQDHKHARRQQVLGCVVPRVDRRDEKHD